jgi:molybdopterin-guanine dinucleotide biosynthesis protein B
MSGIPVVSVVGRSGVGKTTLLEKIVKELKKRNYRIAVIKHDVHGFEMDRPGKDTWILAQAGADIVAISSPRKMAVIEKRSSEYGLDELAEKLTGVDLILTEGYKNEHKPKIEVYRAGIHQELLCRENELLALASDVKWEMGIPCFSLDDAAGIADELEKYMIEFNRREGV